MTLRLRLIHRGNEPEINVFVHGYSAVRTQAAFERRSAQILAARASGATYLLDWQAGDAWNPAMAGWLLDAGVFGLGLLAPGMGSVSASLLRRSLRGVLMTASRHALLQAVNFHRYRLKADELGRQLRTEIGDLPHADTHAINLFGHSLGARVIYNALKTDWEGLPLRNAVLLAGATPADAPDWADCIAKLGGKLYNAWSDADTALTFKPDLEANAGHRPIRTGTHEANRKVVNRKFRGFRHGDYWRKLGDVLGRLGVD